MERTVTCVAPLALVITQRVTRDETRFSPLQLPPQLVLHGESSKRLAPPRNTIAAPIGVSETRVVDPSRTAQHLKQRLHRLLKRCIGQQ